MTSAYSSEEMAQTDSYAQPPNPSADIIWPVMYHIHIPPVDFAASRPSSSAWGKTTNRSIADFARSKRWTVDAFSIDFNGIEKAQWKDNNDSGRREQWGGWLRADDQDNQGDVVHMVNTTRNLVTVMLAKHKNEFQNWEAGRQRPAALGQTLLPLPLERPNLVTTNPVDMRYRPLPEPPSEHSRGLPRLQTIKPHLSQDGATALSHYGTLAGSQAQENTSQLAYRPQAPNMQAKASSQSSFHVAPPIQGRLPSFQDSGDGIDRIYEGEHLKLAPLNPQNLESVRQSSTDRQPRIVPFNPQRAHIDPTLGSGFDPSRRQSYDTRAYPPNPAQAPLGCSQTSEGYVQFPVEHSPSNQIHPAAPTSRNNPQSFLEPGIAYSEANLGHRK
ncbi:hypothetical protein P154DRAFT_540875 [Amniculicola lignicola CBS 123094]|uniref:Uncharacterized protein n=1 Tax=Amniculicola lignicola CBS 123094 TaxID=1392246 RepID=A0A6A5VW14_9PLEO|nr:hypothetical protein P154DRAFT_540875 [Amniculicola lignicola CBS 123094]